MPHGPNRPSQSGHASSPAASHASTSDTFLPTVTTAPPRASMALPATPRQDDREGHLLHQTPHILTLSSHTNDTAAPNPTRPTVHDR